MTISRDADAGVLYLSNIAEVRRLFGLWVPGCTHGADGVTYRLDRLWLEQGFIVEPPVAERIRFPEVLESVCVCQLSEAIA